MRRRIIYLMVGVGIIAVIAGNRFYQKYLAESNGYLGREVIFFTQNILSEDTAESGNKPESVKEEENRGNHNIEKVADAKENTNLETQVPETEVSPSPSPLPVSKPIKKSYDKITSNGEIRAYNTGTVVLDDTAYELYNYVNSSASRYAKAVNTLTKKLDSSVRVYDLIVPTSVGITFPDNKRKKINSSNQEEALKNIENKLSGRESFVPLYDILMQHRKEYIFFKGDHHWTSLGAYYAYCALCEEKGIAPNELSSYRKKSTGGFTGSFFRETNQDKALKADTLEALYPISKNLSMEYTTVDGGKVSAPVIADAEKFSASLKYCVYIAGDNPYTVIRNKDLNDGSSCVVVKESYGNAFVPFLADHYQTIYVIDYRYWEGRLYDFIEKKKLREVIIINNISMTRNSYLIGKMTQIVS